MRVAISNPRRTWGGASTMAVELARGLGARGHQVVVFCHPRSPLGRELEGGIACEPILAGSDFPIPGIWRCARMLRRHRTEVVLSATANDLRLTVPAARLLGIPVVARKVGADAFSRHPIRTLLDRLPDWYVANSLATRAAMLASAPWLAERDVALIPNGTDVNRFASAQPANLGLPVGAFAIGFVGRFDAQKGVMDLAAAWPSIAEALPEAHLVITGGGGSEREFRRRMADAPRVHWLGFRRDIPSVMRALDLLVVPSHSEAFGLVAAEAMAAGVPVIATRVGGLIEVVDGGRAGVLVQHADPPALAHAIIELARDPERRERFAAAGAERVRRLFSWDRVLGEYEALLHRAVVRA